MYPFGDLAGNLTAFCRTLRAGHGFLVGPGEIQDAARALDVVGVADQRTVRDAWRPILAGSREQAVVFDRVFSEFFFPGPTGIAQPGQRPLGNAAAPGRPARRREETYAEEAVERDATSRAAPPASGLGDDEADDRSAVLSRHEYSPMASRDDGTRVVLRLDPEWRDAARLFVRRMHVGLSRRWRPGRRGRRFDPRRTLRTSLQTGGEVLRPRWLSRARRTPWFVLVVDGSRSMDQYARTALDLAVGLASATLRIDVFTFSTGVRRVTREVRAAAAGRAAALERLSEAWGGGTRIGASLARVLSAMERRGAGRDAIVLVASDGLDVGEPRVLGQAMAALGRRSAAVIWLNPLLDTAGYEPSAEGMRMARPYISTFTSVTGPAGLVRLARQIRLRPSC
jgi:uncharacterized protein